MSVVLGSENKGKTRAWELSSAVKKDRKKKALTVWR
jgi:hypothetical protein